MSATDGEGNPHGYIMSKRSYTGEHKVGDTVDVYPLAEPLPTLPLRFWPQAVALPRVPTRPASDAEWEAVFDVRDTLRVIHRERCSCKGTRTLATVYLAPCGLGIHVPSVRRPREKRQDDGLEGAPRWSPAEPASATTTCGGCQQPWLIIFDESALCKIRLKRGAFSSVVQS